MFLVQISPRVPIRSPPLLFHSFLIQVPLILKRELVLLFVGASKFPVKQLVSTVWFRKVFSTIRVVSLISIIVVNGSIAIQITSSPSDWWQPLAWLQAMKPSRTPWLMSWMGFLALTPPKARFWRQWLGRWEILVDHVHQITKNRLNHLAHKPT